MTIFLSAEVQDDVGDALRVARNTIRGVVVPRLAADYGPGVERWSLITILRPRIPDGWGEVTKYHRGDRVAEFRLIVDYSAFKSATVQKRVQMLVESILRSVDLFPVLKVKEFDIGRFRRDIVEAAIAGGLLPPDSPAATLE